MELFHRKKEPVLPYDKENKKPVLKCSICNGEQVAGFLDVHTKQFEEVMFVRDETDLHTFMKMYGLTDRTQIEKIY